MKLSELINFVGDASIVVQNLDTCMTNIATTKDGNLVTFGTKEVSPNDVANNAAPKVGLVVWLPRDKVTEFVQQAEHHCTCGHEHCGG